MPAGCGGAPQCEGGDVPGRTRQAVSADARVLVGRQGQCREDRDGVTGRDEVLDRHIVVGREPHPGGETRLTGEVEQVRAALGAPGDPGRVPQLGQGVGPGQRTVGQHAVSRSDQVGGIPTQVHRRVRGLLSRSAVTEDQGNVDRPGPQELARLRRLGLGEVEFNPGWARPRRSMTRGRRADAASPPSTATPSPRGRGGLTGRPPA